MQVRIQEQPNVFDDAFLDIIGNEFKFDHVKGLAEWIKNSADAYTRADVPDGDQVIILRLTPKTGTAPARFCCIDFVGMTSRDVDEAFKRWGDRRAASRGTGKRTLGGHGNGGKFYMRQMFSTAYFVTFRSGKLNVFGFNERRRYGYAEGFKDKKATLKEALAYATIDAVTIPKAIQERWHTTVPGFTVVIGERPDRLKAWQPQIRDIAQKLPVHPQSRRLIRYKHILLSLPPSEPSRLAAPEIPPKLGFEKPAHFDMPKELAYRGEMFVFRSKRHPDAHLTISTSKEPFGRAGERSALNSVDILGEVGCIGSYRMNELGYLRHTAQAEFLYGECFCPILEDPDEDCVRNDREKLVETEKTFALLSWIREKVDDVAEKLAEEDNRAKRHDELQHSSVLNELLNRWKNQFMSHVFAQVLGGFGLGAGVGGGGEGGSQPWIGGEGRSSGGGRQGGEGTGGTGGADGERKLRTNRTPKVLLSSYDSDPLHPEETKPFDLDPRHPAIYQRPADVGEGIYWINTSRPLAQRIIEQYKVKSTRWREYLFQRYVDIILKESLYQLAKRDPDLTAEKVDDLWDKVQSRVHDSAAEDLESFLFEEGFGHGSSPIA